MSSSTLPVASLSLGRLARTPLVSSNRIAFALALIAIYVVAPWIGNDYWLNSLIIPTIVMGLAGVGLNLLTG